MRDVQERELIGSSALMAKLRQQIHQVAPTDAKVLITGESGVGKELVARALHTQSGRAEQNFVAVNCAGLPETLLESELFGHARGSFTGAFRDQTGKLDAATRAGLKKYQEAEGVKVTGTLNKLTLDKMGITLTDKQKTM